MTRITADRMREIARDIEKLVPLGSPFWFETIRELRKAADDLPEAHREAALESCERELTEARRMLAEARPQALGEAANLVLASWDDGEGGYASKIADAIRAISGSDREAALKSGLSRHPGDTKI